MLCVPMCALDVISSRVFTGSSDSEDEQSEDLLGPGSDESQHAEQDVFDAGAADASRNDSETENDPSVFTPAKRQGVFHQ